MIWKITNYHLTRDVAVKFGDMTDKTPFEE